MSETRIVKILKSQDTSDNPIYFDPKYIEIQRGDTIDWINYDIRNHTLSSQIFGQPTDLLRLGPIKPGETQSRQIIWGISKIDYFCSIHPQEVGTIIILEKPEADLTNTERFRMLSNTFNIKPADSLAHVDSPERKAREAALNDLERPEALVKYFDPLTLEMVLNPQKHQLQSKCLTIAYWDISGFSDMCKQLIDRPSTIILLLKKYFNEANETIHKNYGILDKFIGDGVMAYFGYYDKAGNQAAINAINAAIELKEKFIEIKNEWINESNLKSKNVEIDVKCGIHTGDLLFGIIDTEYRNQLTVNFASRLEGVAKKDDIVISTEIKEKVQDKFTFYEDERQIQSWGKVNVYLVTGRVK